MSTDFMPAACAIWARALRMVVPSLMVTVRSPLVMPSLYCMVTLRSLFSLSLAPPDVRATLVLAGMDFPVVVVSR